jgi:hypothetical protein
MGVLRTKTFGFLELTTCRMICRRSFRCRPNRCRERDWVRDRGSSKKMAAGRRTLAEAFGPPLYGIKTGLNDAFVLTRAQRDTLVAKDARSTHLLKPFLVGENLKRWHVESDDLWLIYTPKNRVKIEDYPAIRDHLIPFREALEGRATDQNWWELQQFPVSEDYLS